MIFTSMHSLTHASVHATKGLVSSRFFWPSMKQDMIQWMCSCPVRQIVKVHSCPVTPLSSFRPPDIRFSHMHIDIAGPFLPPKAIPSPSLWTIATGDGLKQLPFPESEGSGTHVHCSLCGTLWHLYNHNHRPGPAIQVSPFQPAFAYSEHSMYTQRPTSPQANGMVRRFHWQLKFVLASTPDTMHWTDSIPLMLLGIHSSLWQDMACSSAELVYSTIL